MLWSQRYLPDLGISGQDFLDMRRALNPSVGNQEALNSCKALTHVHCAMCNNQKCAMCNKHNVQCVIAFTIQPDIVTVHSIHWRIFLIFAEQRLSQISLECLRWKEPRYVCSWL